MLNGKIALVTGASRGIGRAVVENFAQNGAVVYANARTDGSLDAFTEELKNKYGVQVTPLYFDVTDSDGIKAAFTQIKKEQGRLDILVNNAGIMKDALIGMIPKGIMREVFDVNVFAVVELVQIASKLMIRQKSGSIINLASIVGINGSKGQLVYSASKGAVIAITKSAAKELAQYNIRVNALAPGMIDTDLLNPIGKEHIAELVAEKIGMKRLGASDEVANACAFLASDYSEYITGQILGIDGNALL